MSNTSSDALPSALLAEAGPYDLVAGRFAAIALRAGAVVMDVYREGATVRLKADTSPVCEADERAEAVIHAALAEILPGVPVLAEEAAARGIVPMVDGRFILVDPVDGTKEFLNRNGEFTVNVALIEGGVPRAGAVYAPALERLWLAGERAFVCTVAPGADFAAAVPTRINTRPAPESGLVVMASRSHADERTDRFLSGMPVAARRNAGSSLKFCAVAEGTADLYPRFGPTMEWDTAAGDAVLRGAGGIVLNDDGTVFGYGKADAGFRNGAFLAWGDPAEGRRRTRAAASA